MVIIALLLIALAVVVTVAVLMEATSLVTLDLWGLTATTTSGGMFLIGAAAMLCLLLGVWLLARSVRRSRRRHSDRQHWEQEREAELDRLARDKAELEERLHRREQTRSGIPSPAGATNRNADGSQRHRDDHGDEQTQVIRMDRPSDEERTQQIDLAERERRQPR